MNNETVRSSMTSQHRMYSHH